MHTTELKVNFLTFFLHAQSVGNTVWKIWSQEFFDMQELVLKSSWNAQQMEKDQQGKQHLFVEVFNS